MAALELGEAARQKEDGVAVLIEVVARSEEARRWENNSGGQLSQPAMAGVLTFL
jgi:hypothetical protein